MKPGLQAKHRKIRSAAFYFIVTSILAISICWLISGMRSLLLPIFFGALLAYLCKPIISNVRIRNIKSFLKLCLFTGFVFGFLAIAVVQVKNAIPNETEQMALKVRLHYKIHQIYNDLISKNNTFLSSWLKNETEPFFNDIASTLKLSEGERLRFENTYVNTSKVDLEYKLLAQYLFLKKQYYLVDRLPAAEEASIFSGVKINLSTLYTSFFAWLLMPVVFFFLLFDQGKIRRYFVGFIPNRYFELALTMTYQVDKAIGSYLRGTFLQCSLVGISIFLCFVVIGFPVKAALLISLIAGVANAIPLLGPFIGLIAGLMYSLIAESVSPLIPFINMDNIYIGVILSVIIVQSLDNLYFQPVVLGTAVNLHPLVIVLGVVAGAGIMGWIGMLLAVPSIVMAKVVVQTLNQQLKAYKII